MKRFSDIPSVVHAYAHQTYPECGTYNGNVFYREGVIYSYGHHFPMGRLLGDNHVLLTTRSYSQSTGNHKSKLRQAVNHMQRHYCHNPENPLGRDSIFQTLVDIELRLKSAAKRRSPDLAQADFKSALAMFDEIEWIRAWEKSNKKTVEQWLDWYSWKALTKELKDKWKAVGRSLSLAAVDLNAALANITEAQRKADRRRQLAREKAQKIQTAQAKLCLFNWQQTGERLAGFHSIKAMLGIDGLRLSTMVCLDRPVDLDVVTTTQGARVPAEDCKKAWPLIKAAYARFDKDKCQVEFSGRMRASARLGDFAPNGIDPGGHLLVGCHRFTRESVENLAKALGLI